MNQRRLIMYSLFLIFTLRCIYSSEAFAEVKRVAVLEFRGVGVEQVVLLKLSDQTRVAAVDVLPQDQYLIMTRENMMQILMDMGKDTSCMEGQCEVETGRNIGADIIISGDVMIMEGTYYVTLKLHETVQGGLLSAKNVEAKGFSQLLSHTVIESSNLMIQGLKLPLALRELPKAVVPVSSVQASSHAVSLPSDVAPTSLPAISSLRKSSHIELDLTEHKDTWVIAVAALGSKTKAMAAAEDLRNNSFDAHIIWIGDYPSTSQKPLWLVCVGPYEFRDREDVEEMLRRVQRVEASAYAIKISQQTKRETIR